jgi:pimeloyl-ACP methyl ester carboxylesterase
MTKNIFVFFLLLFFTKYSYTQLKSDSNFIENPVALETSTGKLMGTLTTPLHFTKGPILLMIAGSGPTDRDGNSIVGVKANYLKQIAHEISNSNIASLRFDKRGIGASKLALTKEEELTFDNMVNDVKGWIQFINKDKRFDQIIIAGHSEGSLIGMLAAKKNVDKYISISGPGKPANEILKEQLENQTTAIKETAFPIIDSLSQGFLVKKVHLMLFSLFRPSVQPYLISWFKYDPSKEIASLSTPTLILQGDNDLQVSVNDAELLFEAKKNSKKIIIPNMNHVLKIVGNTKDENIKSYNNPNLPISSELIQAIVNFVNTRNSTH